MKRRAAIVVALTLAAGLATAPALADSPAPDVGRDSTNGCVVVKPVHLAVCIPRF